MPIHTIVTWHVFKLGVFLKWKVGFLGMYWILSTGFKPESITYFKMHGKSQELAPLQQVKIPTLPKGDNIMACYLVACKHSSNESVARSR